MKISIPILDFGKSGGARVLSRLASEWVKMGCEVKFLVHNSSPQPYFPTDATVTWLSDRGDEVNGPRNGDKPFGGVVPRRLLALYRGIERYASDSDVVLANHSLTAWPTFLARTRAKKVYYIQAYEPEYYLETGTRKLLYFASLWSYRLPLVRIVNAPLYLNYKQIKADFYVPPGIDTAVFKPEPRDRVHALPTIGCIGRKELYKGTAQAINAIKLLREQGFRCHFRVAYQVPQTYEMMTDIDLVVPGSDEELAQFYRSLDILVAPGKVQHGAFHYPVMEAMACGVPVVTTGYAPAQHLINAIVVPSDEPQELAAAVKRLWEDRRLMENIVKNGEDTVKAFEWHTVARGFLDLLVR